MVGEISGRVNVRSGKATSGKCPVGELSVGEMSVEDLSSGKCHLFDYLPAASLKLDFTINFFLQIFYYEEHLSRH